MTPEECERLLARCEEVTREGNPPGCLGRSDHFMVPIAIMHELLMVWKSARDGRREGGGNGIT